MKVPRQWVEQNPGKAPFPGGVPCRVDIRVVPLLWAAVLTAIVTGACSTAPTGALRAQGPDSPPVESTAIFRFTTDGFWLNLHHFLYVLGRAEGGARDSERRAVAAAPADQARLLESLPPGRQQTWREAVSIYAQNASLLDAVFDEQLATATGYLALATESIDGPQLPAAWARALQTAAPIYRDLWWPEHRAANQAWVEGLEPLLAAHGGSILDFVERAYGQTWPADGYPVQISGYSNWAGAYSTYGELLVVSSLDEELRGTAQGLEIVFHEAAHQFDDSVHEALVAAANEAGYRFSRDLSHALLFFTVGEAARAAIPGHEPYAHRYGLWQRGMGRYLPALEDAWLPYLEGPSLGDAEGRRRALVQLMVELRDSSSR